MRGKRNTYSFSVGVSEGKTSFGRTRTRRNDDIKIYLEEVGWEVVDWIDWTQGRNKWRAVVNSVKNLLASIKNFN
jgi:hypothetical protein